MTKWGGVSILSVIVSFAIILIGADQMMRADRELDTLVTQREKLATDIGRYMQIQSQREDTLFQVQPRSDFEKRVGEVVSVVGGRQKPRYTVSVLPGQEQRDASGLPTGLEEQRASVSIPNLSMDQVGSFLAYWHEQQSIWIPVSIRLVHSTRSNENLYTLDMECVAKFRNQGSN